MRAIPVGAKGQFTLRVTPAHLANQFKDAMLPPVFATPMMVTAMENAALFDEAERATLALTVEMTRSINVAGATMQRIRALLPYDQVVELVGTIAAYNMVSRFVVATGVELE